MSDNSLLDLITTEGSLSDLVSDKRENLLAAKEEKLNTYTTAPEGVEFEKANLISLRDIDSPLFEGVTGGLGFKKDSEGNLIDKTGRHTNDRLDGIDSYEVFPTSQKSKDYLYNDPNGIRKLALQRASLARKRGVDLDEITDEDVFEEGAKGAVKTLAVLRARATGDEDYLNRVLAWEPSKELTKQWRTSAPELGSRENPLNIEVERAFLNEYGAYGRPLSYVRGVGSEELLGTEAGYVYSSERPRQEFIQTEIFYPKDTSLRERMMMDEVDTATLGDRASNALSGFGVSVINEMVAKPIDAIGDITGLYDLGNENSLTETLNESLGYNPIFAEQAMVDIGKQWNIVANENASITDRVKAAFSGAMTAAMTPEMGATSLGAVMAWAAPGALLKGVGFGSKYFDDIVKIERKFRAGDITSAAARSQKLKALASVDGVKGLLTAQSGMITSAIGNVNQQYEEFVINNNGVEPEGGRASFFATRLPIQLINQNLDKFVTLDIMKNPGLLKSALPAVKAMTNKEFAGVAEHIAKGLLKTGLNAGEEAAQEYAQTMMELFNSRYGSEKFKDADSFAAFLSDKRNTTEAGIAMLAGAGGALQFEALGTVLPAAAGTASLAGKGFNAGKAFLESKSAAPSLTREEEVANVEQVKEFISQVSANPSSPLAAYYAAKSAADEASQTRATEEAAQARDSIVNGTNPIFRSDADMSSKLEQLVPYIEMATAEDPSMGVNALMESMLKALRATTKKEQQEVKEAVTKAVKAGKAFSSIKSLEAVSEEVTRGAGGYVTYFTNAKIAQAEGNEEAYNTSLDKLDYFYNYEKTKLSRYNAGIEQVKGVVEASIDNLVKNKKVKSRRQALNQLISEYKDNDKAILTVEHSDEPKSPTTEIRYSDIALKLANPNYNKGIYRLQRIVKNEVADMAKVHNALLGEELEVVTPTPDPVVATPNEEIEVPAPTTTVSKESVELDVPDAVSEEDLDALEKAATAEVEPDISNAPEVTVDEPLLEDFPDDFNIPEDDEAALDALEASLSSPSFEDAFDVPSDQVFDEEFENLSVEPEDFSVSADEADFDISDYDEYIVEVEDDTVSKESSKKPDKAEKVRKFVKLRDDIKKINKRISNRRSQLRQQGVYSKKEQDEDSELQGMFIVKDALVDSKNTFTNTVSDVVKTRMQLLADKFKDPDIVLYKKWTKDESIARDYEAKGHFIELSPKSGKWAIDFSIPLPKLFETFAPTGFTLVPKTKKDVSLATKQFVKRLLDQSGITTGKVSPLFLDGIKSNPLNVLLFDSQGEVNYNVAEAIQSAAYEYVSQEASNLRGTARTEEEVAELFGIPEDNVTAEMMMELANGGVTLKLAAAAIGTKAIQNVGLSVKNIQDKEALATSLGMGILQGLEGDFLESFTYIPTKTEKKDNGGSLLADSIPMLRGTSAMFGRLKAARSTLDTFEATLGVEVDKERTYRTEPIGTYNKVQIHKAEHQEAPKDHTDVVNKLKDTAFKFNSGNSVLLELFSDKDGKLDVPAIVTHMLGSPDGITNLDGMDRYEAKKEALERDLKHFQEAMADVEDKALYFDWFIARNQRIHLDSNRLNPQNDKNLARWLVTTENSVKDINKSTIEQVINGTFQGSEVARMEAVMFAYSIVQAFDGNDGIAEIDKNNEQEVLNAAKELLENTPEATLVDMAYNAVHLGHAALAIANIRKYANASDVFTSDMVLEVDGLTNGFAFRAMQFPVESPNSPVGSFEWLAKVGVVTAQSALYTLDSMNGAGTLNQKDVYVSVGDTFGDNMAAQKASLKPESTAAKWINLFEEYGKLPDFSNSSDPGVKSFIRKLMKSPVMVFNYAASVGKITSSLVDDQIKGTGYLQGKGLIDLLTELDDEGNYIVSENKLIKTFGKALGGRYHKARVALKEHSLISKDDSDIILLRKNLQFAISSLYAKPLEDTLSDLFSAQTEINTSFVNAAQFMFDHFQEEYDLWRAQNPKATEEDKLNFLRDIAGIIPGIGAASSDSQLNKITFLKNVLDSTSNDVVTTIGGKRRSANTVSRTFGEPGVGPAVLTVLSLDSSVLARSINEAYKGKKGEGALPVHDAIVLGIAEADTISSYNRNFYTTNRGYSISDEFVKAIENFEQKVPGAIHRKIVNNKGQTIKFPEMRDTLKLRNTEIQNARKKVFDKDVKVGQLVGPEGTMFKVDVATAKADSVAYLASVATQVNAEVSSDKVKKALGKEYKAFKAKIDKMIEGCK